MRCILRSTNERLIYVGLLQKSYFIELFFLAKSHSFRVAAGIKIRHDL